MAHPTPKDVYKLCWGSEAPPQRMCTNSWGSEAPPNAKDVNKL